MDFSAKSELGYLARIVEALDEAAPELDWLLVGALARDLHLQHAHGIKIERATTDVDFAIAVRDWKDFYRIRSALLDTGNFGPVSGVEHQIVFDGVSRIDLVPFGGVESPDRTISWPPEGSPVMNVVGFSEALRTANRVELPFGQSVLVVCLPMLLLLKLMAWRDRHVRRPGVDAGDILLILRNYTECGNFERMAEQHSDLMERPDFDYETSGSVLVGRDLTCLLSEAAGDSPRALEQALDIVSSQLQQELPGALIRGVPSDEMDKFRQLLEAFGEGLNWKH